MTNWQAASLFWKHAQRDLARRKCHYTLAFLSVFIVVLSTLVVTSIVNKGPIIFLKKAQSHHGEVDAYITPRTYTDVAQNGGQGTFLNYTQIDKITNSTYNIAPRKTFCGVGTDIYNKRTILNRYNGFITRPGKIDEMDYSDYFESMFLPDKDDLYDAPQPGGWACLYLLNTNREKQIGLGRNYTFKPLDVGQCNLHQDFQKQIGASIGDIIFFDMVADNLLNLIIKDYNIYANEHGYKPASQVKQLSLRVPCQVQQMLTSSYGKFREQDLKHVAILEYDRFLPLLTDYIPHMHGLDENEEFLMYLKTRADLNSYADQVVMTLPQPSYNFYSSDNFDTIQRQVTSYTNKLVTDLGTYPVSAQLFILEEMQKYSMGILFVHLIFDIVIAIFVIISVLLIYSLMMVGVETKTMETGIMRMVGLSKRSFIQVIFYESLLYVGPALFIGFVLSFPILAILYTYVFKEHLSGAFVPVPTGFAVLLTLGVGFLIPMISAIVPIFRVLGQSLTDSLSYDRSKVKALYIEILKKSRFDIVPVLILGTLSVLFGAAIFYVLPLSLLSMNLGLILKIFLCILLGMLLGLSMFTFNIQRLFMTLLTHVFLFYEKRSMKLMVLNNLSAHRQRNKMTGLIYSLALGFIIFLIVSYKMQFEEGYIRELQKYGNYPMISANTPEYLQPHIIEPFIEAHQDKIKSFTWVTFDLFRVSFVSNVVMSDIAKLHSKRVGLYAVQPNVYETTGDRFLETYYKDSGTGLSLGEQLYTPRGTQGLGLSAVVMMETQSNPVKVGLDKYLLMNFEGSTKIQYKMRPIFANSRSPLFTMVDREIDIQRFKNTALTSLPMFARYLNVTMADMPYERLIFKLKDGATLADQQALINDLKMKLPPRTTQGLFFHMGENAQLSEIDRILEIIFDTIIAIVMFLCFFSLSSTMTANLYEQAKEIGVLRAIGYTKRRIVTLFVYEAFILVMASSLLGVMIGLFCGWTMVAQQVLWENLPVTFYFPWIQTIIIFLVSILCAFLSTFGQTKRIMNKEIANVLRNT